MRILLSLLLLAALLAPARASVRVQVDIASQTMRVEASSGERYQWRISTGRWGYRTPNGIYRPQRLERHWRSRRYGMAPMPHSVFFHGGYAIHGTTDIGQLGRPASHGCIRLHPAAAATLFNLVQRHSMAATRIEIRGSRRDIEAPPVALLRTPRLVAQQAPVRLRRPAPVWAEAPAPRRRLVRRTPTYGYPAGYGAYPPAYFPYSAPVYYGGGYYIVR